MQHDMKQPCPECPFRNDIRGYLTGDRVSEICGSLLRGESFPCHKTVEYGDEDDGRTTEASRQCAGAEIFLAHQGQSTQMSRIMERLGQKVATLNMDAPVCRNMHEMMEIHAPEDAEGETCHVCAPDCLAPAGYMVGGGVVTGTDYVDTYCAECGEAVCDNCSTSIKGGERVCADCAEN